MKEWTDSARAVLEDYLRRTRPSLDSTEAEPEEVLDDIRRHVEEEVRVLNVDVVTDEVVRGVLRRMGPAVSPKERALRPESTPVARPGWLARSAFLTFGVLAPAASLLTELATRICATTFFDPLPTLWHAILAALVPISNGLVLFSLGRAAARPRLLGFLNSFAIGVSLFYSLVFLPLLPLALLAVLFLIGLLPLGPYAAVIVAAWLRRRLRTELGRPVPWFWAAAVLGLLILPVIQIRTTLTAYGLHRAASEDLEVRNSGIRLLRRVGDEDVLLRACYERSGIGTDMIGFALGLANPITPEKAREVYFRVTGRLFNSVAPPKLAGTRHVNPIVDFEFDPDVAGESVAGRLRGLHLSASRLDGSMDPDAAVAYLEWTLVFRNTSSREQEARAEIATPPEGVVSRVTLWIDGEEREAAFGGRAQTRAAYESVVRKRRDPLLVTSRGRDRVLVQCFPVPPNGGEMKIRIGMTCPLLLRTRSEGYLRLPFFHERNFNIPGEVRHSVWVESSRALKPSTDALKIDGFKVRGEMPVSALEGEGTVIVAAREASVIAARGPEPDGEEIRATLSEEKTEAPSRVVFVLDGSRGMRRGIPQVAESLQRFPLGTEIGVLIASDDVLDLSPGVRTASAESLRDLSEKLRRLEPVGGCDNLPALVRAWDLASERKGAVILWIHGPHPLLFGKAEGLRQRWERRARDPILLDYQVAPGPNTISGELDRIPWIQALPSVSGLPRDLDHALAEWRGETKTLKWSRKKDKEGAAGDHKTSAHLARLWAYEQVLGAMRADRRDEALATAVRHQLVTPVSGAVVLETKEQYKAAGLEPVPVGTVPTIPEPGEWLLFLIALGVLIWAIRRKRALLRAA